MSTKKQERKEEESTQSHSTTAQRQREQQQAVNKAFDETKDNIKKTTNEARNIFFIF